MQIPPIRDKFSAKHDSMDQSQKEYEAREMMEYLRGVKYRRDLNEREQSIFDLLVWLFEDGRKPEMK